MIFVVIALEFCFAWVLVSSIASALTYKNQYSNTRQALRTEDSFRHASLPSAFACLYVMAPLYRTRCMSNDILFEASTPLDFKVRATSEYWNVIVCVKHPVMRARHAGVQQALQTADEIRRSRSDPGVLLFYKLERIGRWLCAVVKRLNGEGFLITAYPTDTIKEGEKIWSK
jgi:hypothetical protein